MNISLYHVFIFMLKTFFFFFVQDEMKQLARNERVAIYASNVANLVLFLAKVYASFESRSLAVIASTLDSLLDLLSGFILWFTAYAMKKPNQYRYPIGKQRMQPVVGLIPSADLEIKAVYALPVHCFSVP
jgi:divalent metal cation (Fe/Co/Zn/Cd) transporter